MRDSKVKCGMANSSSSSSSTRGKSATVDELSSMANKGTDDVEAVVASYAETLPVAEPTLTIDNEKVGDDSGVGVDAGNDVISAAAGAAISHGSHKVVNHADAEGCAITISTTWRSKARSLASINLRRLEICPPFIFLDDSTTNQDNDATVKKLQAFVHSILADSSSFPSKVCIALHATYTNMKFRTNVDTIVNTRECLDAVTASFISALPDNKPLHAWGEEGISSAVDQYMLQLSRRSMYAKAYAAAVALTDDQDHALVAALTTMTVLDPARTDRSSADAQAALRRVADCLSPRDKLHQLHTAVGLLVRSEGSDRSDRVDEPEGGGDSNGDGTEGHIDVNGQGAVRIEYPDGGTANAVSGRKDDRNGRDGESSHQESNSSPVHSPVHSTVQSPLHLTVQPTAVGADDLLERLVHLLCDIAADAKTTAETATTATATTSATAETTGRTGRTARTARTAAPLRSTARIRWFAECAFIGHMMRPEGDWMLGAEGYAYTTLQQALQSCVSSSHTTTNTTTHTNTTYIHSTT